MADVCNVFIAHAFELFNIGGVFENADCADTSLRVGQDRNDRDPQYAIAGQIIVEHTRLFGVNDGFKRLPNGSVGNEVHGRMDLYSAEQLHQSGIEVRKLSLLVDGGNAVAEAGKDISELPLFVFKLADRRGQCAAHVVQRAGKESEFSGIRILCTDVVVPFGQLLCDLRHLIDRMQHLVDGEIGRQNEKRQ